MIDSKELEMALFNTARELSNTEIRKAFLEQACNGNTDLRERLEKLLAIQDSAEVFFNNNLVLASTAIPGVETTHSSAARLSPPRTNSLEAVGIIIGRYKLLQRLGEGGCGVVYLAEQEKPIQRRVALKIIRLGMDTESVIARFEAERQALALMEHLNIARVLDAGTTDSGRPYFVMELVMGMKVTDFCDKNQFDISQRLRLFIQICHAIQHAHQKGIIHRDIKPSNILVVLHNGLPLPKVIDFGIAKAVEGRLADNTMHTAADQFIGTPAYMSPEQAERSGLDVDTRSDIYSLGVLLYELLTGQTPFDSKQLLNSGVDEIRRILREHEPQIPSTMLTQLSETQIAGIADQHNTEPPRLISSVRGDLDWIVMKAMEKDRQRRYETVNGLALDVQRYLDSEPILARPPSQFYRFQKLVRRNKIIFAAGGVTVFILIASSSVSTWLLVKERVARQRAIMAEQQKGSLEKEASALHENAEKRLKLSKALALFDQGQNEQADAILDILTNPPVVPEYASVYRSLGDWHVLNGRWAKARARFEVLVQIDELENADTSMDDIRSAALLADQGYFEDYERFRESLITRYTSVNDPIVAERVLRECLLTPADNEMLKAMGSFAATTENVPAAKKGGPLPVWSSYAMALLAYRRHDYDAALKWCRGVPSGQVARDLSVQLIQAMAHKQLGQDEVAKAELDACRLVIKQKFELEAAANQWQGFWWDRVCVRIHLREATELIEGEPQATE